jgi:hypothetical protein
MSPSYFDPESRLVVLDLLVDGPGSFLSLYGELTRFHGFPPDVNLLMDHLEAHEAEGHIELRVSVGGGELINPSPNDRSRARDRYQELLLRRPDEFAADEIGFWYFLTPAGRDVWQQSTTSSPRDDSRDDAAWVIEADALSGNLVVFAKTRKGAKAALNRHLRASGLVVAPESVAIEDVESFKLASGQEMRPAVRLTARCVPRPRGSRT